MTRTITIASGKGGVGKTSLSVNVSLHLAALGYTTCLFDADLGLANINILLGLSPAHTVEDMILGEQSIHDIVMRDRYGIDIIPGSSGVEKMADLEEDQLQALSRSFAELNGYDFFVFDTSAGVSKQVIAFCLAASEVVLVITPEPTSLTDAYALLKILLRNDFKGQARVVINQCTSPKVAKQAYAKFKQAVKHHLDAEVVPLGFVYNDPKVVKAVSAQQPFVLQYPQSNASKCIKNIARNLLHNHPENMQNLGMDSFWTRCLNLIRSPLSLEGFSQQQHGNPPAPSDGPLPNTPSQQGGESTQNAAPAVEGGYTNHAPPPEAAPMQPPKPREEPPPSTLAAGTTASAASLPWQDVVPLMGELVASFSSMTQELQLIRQAMEKTGQAWKSDQPLSPGKGMHKNPHALMLDYEAYSARRKQRKN